MLQLTRWLNLSETTFLLPPTDAAADYRVRIFSPPGELPFAGHPTLGTCHAWLSAGGLAKQPGRVVQECGVGLVTVRQDSDGYARVAAPHPPAPSPQGEKGEEVASAKRGAPPTREWQAREPSPHRGRGQGEGWPPPIFAAPPLVRAGAADGPTRERLARVPRIGADEIVRAPGDRPRASGPCPPRAG
jgi:hypothetical protein